MIPTHIPFQARFRHQQEGAADTFSFKPVAAWDVDGDALVVDESKGCLRLASGYSNFAGVFPADDVFVGVIPGGGWEVLYDVEGEPVVEPLVAWRVRQDGVLVATDTDKDGFTFAPSSLGNFVRLVAPGEPRPISLDETE
ncbi:hypothetical protein [Streptomyces zhihengii]